MIKAVIFDMDGVLIDSEIVYVNHICKVLQKTYPTLIPSDLFPIVGSTSSKTRELIFKAVDEPMDSIEFNQAYRHIWEGLKIDFPSILRKEVVPLLKKLQEMDYLIALASSTSQKGINEVIDSCQIRQYFNFIISGEMFKESKPNPEIYIHTSENLKCSPGQCLVIEDSTYGITAGHEAGMTVAALIDERFAFDYNLSDYQINSLDEVLAVLDKAGGTL